MYTHVRVSIARALGSWAGHALYDIHAYAWASWATTARPGPGDHAHYRAHVSFGPEVVKYTNVAFGTNKSVLFMEVSLIQGCPYRRDLRVQLYMLIQM